MDLQKIDAIKKTITFLLENGDFADIETAYNISMNALNDIDELYKQDQETKRNYLKLSMAISLNLNYLK